MTYKEFIQGIIDSRGQWPEEIRAEYCERHHIVPKCLGGEPKKLTWKHHENVIWLTAQEHFIAHKLLAEENPDNSSIVGAWCCMAFPKGKTKREYELTPKEYEEVRIAWSKVCSFRQLGRKPWNKGKTGVYSEEALKQMSESSKGRSHKVSEETRRRMSESARQRDWTDFKPACAGKICITDGVINKYIEKDANIPEGFRKGMTETAGPEKRIQSWTEERRKAQSERSSGKNNNMYGNGYKLAGGNNGKATKRYYYKDLVFECRKELVQYLKENVDERICVGTIRAFENGGKRVLKKFNDILKDLTWVYKNEDKKD